MASYSYLAGRVLGITRHDTLARSAENWSEVEEEEEEKEDEGISMGADGRSRPRTRATYAQLQQIELPTIARNTPHDGVLVKEYEAAIKVYCPDTRTQHVDARFDSGADVHFIRYDKLVEWV